MTNPRLAYLFKRHYEKKATIEEKEELLDLIQDEALAMQLNDLVEATLKQPHPGFELDDERAGHILSAILQMDKDEEEVIVDKKPRRQMRKWYYAAAAILLLLSFGGTFHLLRVPTSLTTRVSVVHDVAPGGSKAMLTLADGSSIALDEAHNGSLAQQGNVKVIKGASGQLTYQPSNDGKSTASVLYNTLTTPRGGQYQVVLPDGTKVWLNASSSLTYPTAFTGTYRTVHLTGEGYFEVTPNANKPFHVEVQGMDVAVLGTHFNIMAYADEDAIKTTLVEGAVKVTKGKASALLAPGEQASIETEGTLFTKNAIDPESEIAWKNGFIQFSDATVPAIMRQVSRWYNIEVVYKNSIPKMELAGKVPRTVPLSQLLSMLAYTGLRCTLQDGKIVVLN